MPLTDLIHYFNTSDLAGDSTLYVENERAAAWHDGLRLRSLFQPIIDAQTGAITGHQACLAATSEDGTPLVSDAAYERNQTAESIVHFDRLCRTLHALNFLAQRRHAGGYLQLSVDQRHLLAVTGKHGLVFEAVLKRCGLAPDDLVLEITAGEHLNDPHLALAVRNYQDRGYRIALTGTTALPAGFTPDIIKGIPAHLPFLPQSQRQGTDISNASHLRDARQHGMNLLQGDLFGRAQNNCLFTHGPNRVTYNLDKLILEPA